METRLVVAYLLIAAMVVAAGLLAAFARYNRHDRKIARQRGRLDDARVRRIQEAADSPSD